MLKGILIIYTKFAHLNLKKDVVPTYSMVKLMIIKSKLTKSKNYYLKNLKIKKIFWKSDHIWATHY